MRSPFKFLDSFTLKDKDVFFGREEASLKLYNMVFESPIVLVYGLSGTGKTSLIQCGLASKFDGPDWFPFFIRREQNINDALHEALNFHLEDYETSINLEEKVGLLYGDYLSPVYLIFDQLEELFILGSQEEQDEFIRSIRNLLDAELNCRIILSMREEYLGYLYDLEQIIPNIFDFRLRVEPMTSSRIKKVINSSFEKFNISLESPKEKRLQEMLDNISGEKFGVQLPYLQVYLDLLYRSDYKRTYGDKPPTEKFPPLTFTKQEIEEAGKIEDVLEHFIKEQEVSLQEELEYEFDAVPDDVVKKILDAFVTREGTKRPVNYTREGDFVYPDPNETFKDLTSFVPPEVLSHILNALAAKRILRFTDNTIELAHDSIADLIDQNRTEQQRQINQIYRRIKNNYIEYRDNEVYLTEKQLNVIDEYLHLLTLDDNIQQFIDQSREEVKRLKKEEEEKKRAKLLRKIFPVIVGLAGLAIFLGILAFIQRNDAIEANKELVRQDIRFKMSMGASLKNGGNYEEAIELLDSAKQKIVDSGLLGDSADIIDASLERYVRIQEKVSLGDSLLELDDKDLTDSFKLKALYLYEDALAVEEDTLTKVKRQNTQSSIKEDAIKWYTKAQIFTEFGSVEGRQMAIDALKYAMMLDSTQTEMIKDIKQKLGID